MALTTKQIEKLNTPGRYHDGYGLHLQVRSTRNRSWLLRYERSGRERWMGLGSFSLFSLSEARDRARKARQLLYDGRDPLEERRTLVKLAEEQASRRTDAKTFSQVATEYFEQHQAKWRNRKHRAQFLSTLKQYAYPLLGHWSIADVDRAKILRVLDPIWKTKPETANRIRGRIEAVLNFAAVRGYRDGDNPARWKGHLDQVLLGKSYIRKVKHHRALPFKDISSFCAALRKRAGVAARAMEFLILTAARTSEVTGAQWPEIDFETRTWTVPADRMKAKREHRVPLSDAAISLLMQLPRENGNPFVFVGPRKLGISNMAMDAVLKRLEMKNRATVHGFRSSFRDWVAETTNYQNHVAEAALAHVVGDRVEAAYRRGDLFERRRKMMADWARYCDGGVQSVQSITAIRAA